MIVSNLKDSHQNIDSYRENIEKEKHLYTTPHTPHTPHNEKREATQIRLRKSIHRSVMKYCALARITAGQFYEEAAILFMDLNPTEGTLINVTRPQIQDMSTRDRMALMICTRELEEIIPALKTLHMNDRCIPKTLLEKLIKTFDKCYKIASPSEQLNNLIEEALEYVG